MPTKRVKSLVQGDTVELTNGAIGRVKNIRPTSLFQTTSGRAYEIDITILTKPENGKHITEFHAGDTLVSVSEISTE
jgi:preprotein translocase subunit YajC